MRILQAASEFFPYSKTGGLADMVAGLSGALTELGEDVTVATPLYRGIRDQLPDLKPFGPKFNVPLGDREFTGRWWKAVDPKGLTILFLEQEGFYDRPGIYMVNGEGYWDNPERFMFLSKAVAQLAGGFEVVHVHDWQTAFVPMLLHANDTKRIPRTVFTIHNLAYQGQCEGARFGITNLPWEKFHSEGPEFWGDLNFLKAGLHYADAITTVSPRYAKEILAPEFGEGMEGVLQSRQDVLSGILNGVDYDEWNTVNNPHLPASYHVGDLAGKKICKQFLQKDVGLPVSDIPLFGTVSRLAEQKGISVLVETLANILCENKMQFVGLGSGDRQLADKLNSLQKRFPNQVRFVDGYSNALAHQIEAGADYFVMPSRFEPCGLNQMYSLRYGTIPIVNGVGGLADTVHDIGLDKSTGLVLSQLNTEELTSALKLACGIYSSDQFSEMIQRGMGADFGWPKASADYLNCYHGKTI